MITSTHTKTPRWIFRIGRIGSNFLNFFTPRRTHRLAAGLLTAFFLVVVLTARADAQVVDNITVGIFTTLNTILFALIQTVGKIISLLIQLLVAISSYNKFTTVRVVDIGWTIVKDVSNMLFIIALLVIAAGTVLRLENYRYNRLLSNLIIMAFLTNYSKLIAAFLIQGAQVLMLTFVNAYKDAMFGNFVSLFGIDSVLKFNPNTSGGGIDSMSIFGNMLGSLILMVVAFVVTVAICIVLVARIVALWILVIMSPFAFASQILPNTKAFASRWWSEFGKYVSQGPILAFFLWLALAIVNVGGGAASVDKTFGEIATNVAGSQESANFFAVNSFSPDNLITFIISVAFLMFGLQYATSTSGAVGRFAKDFATGKTGVSPMSFIRDRTVAPVQGWIQKRGAARSAAVQERSQTLEAFGDRQAARFAPTRAGREKAQAAANVYERQRTQRFIQARGMQDMSTGALQTRLQHPADPREGLAALQALQQRGAVNLGDPYQRQAFEGVINQQRLPAGEKKKLREEMMTNYAKGLNEDQARQRYDEAVVAGNKVDRIVFAQRLQEANALRGEEGENIIRGLRQDLSDSPDKLRLYDALLMKTNQDMAKKVLFNDLQTEEDRHNFLLAIQQKSMSQTAITDDVQEKFENAGEAEAGAIAKFWLNNSPDEDTLRANTRGINTEVLERITQHGNLSGEADVKRKAWARVTGRWGQAFVGSGDATQSDSAKRQEYMGKIGGDEISKTIAAGELTDKELIKDLYEADNVKIIHLINMMNRSKEVRTAYTEGLTKLADSGDVVKDATQAISVDKDEIATLTGKNEADAVEQVALNQFTALNLALASRGKELRYNTDNSRGEHALQQLMRDSKAADLNKIDESDLYKNAKEKIQTMYGIFAKPNEVAEMLLENNTFAEAALRDAQTKLLDEAKNAAQKSDRDRARSRLKEMARNPTLSYFIAVPEKFEE